MPTTALARAENPMLQKLGTGKASYRSEKEQADVALMLVQQLGLRWESSPIRFLQDRQGNIQPYLTASGAADIMVTTGASVTDLSTSVLEGCVVCRCTVATKDGRTGVGTGVVSIDGLKGEAKANAFMKAETKAIRRTTLRTCRPDAAWLMQEDDIETVPGMKAIETKAVEFPANELPEPGATAPAHARRAPSAPKPAPSASDSDKSLATATTKEVVILNTVYKTEPVTHYVITVREAEAQPFEPAIEHELLTADEPMYQRAAAAEGSGELFAATWHNSRRPNGEVGKTLDALVAA